MLSGLSPDGKLVEMVETPGPPLVRGVPVPPRVQVAAHGPPPLVPGVRRGQPGCAAVPGKRSEGSPRSVGSGSAGGSPLALIAGPCVLESEELVLTTASSAAGCGRARGNAPGLQGLLRQGQPHPSRLVPGARTGAGPRHPRAGPRGGRGARARRRARPAEEARRAAPVLDCLQVPAFLARQTDLLVAAGAHRQGGQREEGAVPGPGGHGPGGGQGRAGGDGGVLFTERGTTFGYRYLVVDFQGMARMAGPGFPVVFDATHSVQQTGGRLRRVRGATGSRRRAPGPCGGGGRSRRGVLRGASGPGPGPAAMAPTPSPWTFGGAFSRQILAIDRARRETA